MTQVLGYPKFAAHGGDFGASITEQLVLHHAVVLLALHINNVPQRLPLAGLPAGEQRYLKESKSWSEKKKARLPTFKALNPRL